MIASHVDLTQYNTFGIQVFAKEFSSFSTVAQLHQLVSSNRKKELFILGGGSNILFTQDFNGLILRNEIMCKEVIQEDETHVYLKAGAGENWHQFVLYCIENNWGGIENLSLIPGSIGASPMQNIGAYGVEIKDVFHELEAYHIPSEEIKTFSHEACAFGYRESIFKRALKGQFVILNVTYKLTKNNHTLKTTYGDIEAELSSHNIITPSIRDISNAVIAIRQSKLPDPKEIGNAGSFFKNPVVEKSILQKIKKNYPNVPSYPVDDNHVKLPAGWLIDTAGWKGKRIGNHGVHAKQALVLVNYSDAKGQQIYDLSTAILKDIYAKFGVELEREVNIL